MHYINDISNNAEVDDRRVEVLKADKKDYKVEFILKDGYFKRLRFRITTKNDPKGEVSDDFVVPLDDSFDMQIPGKLSLDCSGCSKNNPFSYSKNSWTVKFNIAPLTKLFCQLCSDSTEKQKTVKDQLVKLFTSSDFNNKVKSKDKNDEEVNKAADNLTKEDRKKLIEDFTAKWNPASFAISCPKCTFSASYQAYNLEAALLDVKSANIKADIAWNLELQITISTSYSVTSTTNRTKLINEFIKKAGQADAVNDANKFDGLSMPLLGADIGSKIGPLKDKFKIKVGIFLTFSFSLSGKVVFVVSASGATKLSVEIMDDTTRTYKAEDVKKPTFDIKLKSAEITFTASVSLEGSVDLELEKIFTIKAQVILASLKGTATFSFTGFAASSSGLNCNKSHHLEFTLNLNLIEIKFTFSLLKFGVVNYAVPKFIDPITLGKLCLA